MPNAVSFHLLCFVWWKKFSFKAKQLSCNGTWVETVASRMGQNAHQTENSKQTFAPCDSPWERPCFNSDTVSTQGFCLVLLIQSYMSSSPCHQIFPVSASRKFIQLLKQKEKLQHIRIQIILLESISEFISDNQKCDCQRHTWLPYSLKPARISLDRSGFGFVSWVDVVLLASAINFQRTKRKCSQKTKFCDQNSGCICGFLFRRRHGVKFGQKKERSSTQKASVRETLTSSRHPLIKYENVTHETLVSRPR